MRSWLDHCKFCWCKDSNSRSALPTTTAPVFNFFKGAQIGGEPGIFLIFVYFLSQLQRLRPLGYCAHQTFIRQTKFAFKFCLPNETCILVAQSFMCWRSRIGPPKKFLFVADVVYFHFSSLTWSSVSKIFREKWVICQAWKIWRRD